MNIKIIFWVSITSIISFCIGFYIRKDRKEPKSNFLSFNSRHKRLIIIFILVLLLIAGIGVLKGYSPSIPFLEIIKIFFSGLIVITLFYSILSFEATTEKTKNDIRIAKASTTFNCMTEWHKEPMVTYVKTCADFVATDTFKLLKKDISKFMTVFETPPFALERKSLFSVLNFFETIAAAIEIEIMDEEYVKKFYKSIFFDYYNRFNDFIIERRKEKGTPLKPGTAYISYTTLVEKWKLALENNS